MKILQSIRVVLWEEKFGRIYIEIWTDIHRNLDGYTYITFGKIVQPLIYNVGK